MYKRHGEFTTKDQDAIRRAVEAGYVSRTEYRAAILFVWACGLLAGMVAGFLIGIVK